MANEELPSLIERIVASRQQVNSDPYDAARYGGALLSPAQTPAQPLTNTPTSPIPPSGPDITQQILQQASQGPAAATAPQQEQRGEKAKESTPTSEILAKLMKDLGSTKKSFGPDVFDSKLGGVLGSGISPMAAILFGLGAVATRKAPTQTAWNVSMKLMGLPQEYEQAQEQLAQSKIQQAMGLLGLDQKQKKFDQEEQQLAARENLAQAIEGGGVQERPLAPEQLTAPDTGDPFQDAIAGGGLQTEQTKTPASRAEQILAQMVRAGMNVPPAALGYGAAATPPNSFEAALMRQLPANAGPKEILDLATKLRSTYPERTGVGADSQTWSELRRQNPNDSIEELNRKFNDIVGNRREVLGERGAYGAQAGALKLKESERFLKNLADIEEAKEEGRPLDQKDRDIVAVMQQGLRVGHQIRTEFTPEQRAKYVGLLKFPINQWKLLFREDPGFARFSTLIDEGRTAAFSDGGKQLTPFEASVVFGYIPTGREFSAGQFEAKLAEVAEFGANTIKNRISLAKTPRGKLGTDGRPLAAPAPSRAAPRIPPPPGKNPQRVEE